MQYGPHNPRPDTESLLYQLQHPSALELRFRAGGQGDQSGHIRTELSAYVPDPTFVGPKVSTVIRSGTGIYQINGGNRGVTSVRCLCANVHEPDLGGSVELIDALRRGPVIAPHAREALTAMGITPEALIKRRQEQVRGVFGEIVDDADQPPLEGRAVPVPQDEGGRGHGEDEEVDIDANNARAFERQHAVLDFISDPAALERYTVDGLRERLARLGFTSEPFTEAQLAWGVTYGRPDVRTTAMLLTADDRIVTVVVNENATYCIKVSAFDALTAGDTADVAQTVGQQLGFIGTGAEGSPSLASTGPRCAAWLRSMETRFEGVRKAVADYRGFFLERFGPKKEKEGDA